MDFIIAMQEIKSELNHYILIIYTATSMLILECILTRDQIVQHQDFLK